MSSAHWDDKYRSTGVAEVSWYRPHESWTREIFARWHVTPRQSVIDVGGGASSLACSLATDGWTDVTVLDVSAVAVSAAQESCQRRDQVRWVVEDALVWAPGRTYDVWHDRALFHFLREPAEVTAYCERLHAALAQGGTAVIGTFAPDGPTQCSGLTVQRYGVGDLVDALSGATGDAPRELTLLESLREEHRTPSGAVQPFTWVVLRAG